MSTHMRNAAMWSIPGASHWVTFRGRVYQVLLLLLLFNCCLCCSPLFVMDITVYLCSFFFIYRPPRRKVNIIYCMPHSLSHAQAALQVRTKCDESKKKCKKLNTVNTMNAMNTRALVGPVAICVFFLQLLWHNIISVSTFPHFRRQQAGKLQIKSDGRVWVIMYRIVYYYISYCCMLYVYYEC